MTQSLCALLHSLYSLPLTQGANPTHLSCLSLYHSKDLQRLELPSTKNPFIFVVLQGRLALHNPLHTPFGIRIYTDNTNYTSNTGNTNNQYFISSLTTPLKASIMPSKESFYALCLSLDRKECMQVLLHMETSTVTSIIKQTRTAKQRQDCDSALLESLARLFSQKTDSIFFLQSLIIKEIIYHALCGTYGNALLDTLTKVRELDSIYKANAWIKEHFARNFTVKDLAKRSAMSVSAFHKQFKNTIGMSVMQCQKALRLSEARRLLVWEDYNVTQAAFEVGYESLSQFIREYKRAFIVSPKEDRQALLAQIGRI